MEFELEELDLSEFELIETKNPYKGLRAFQQADAADFFGRSAMIQRVLDRLQEPVVENNFLAVIGPSGSGKSSLVKAGVLPALRSGRIPGSENWFYAEMVPGEVPLEELGERAAERLDFAAARNGRHPARACRWLGARRLRSVALQRQQAAADD